MRVVVECTRSPLAPRDRDKGAVEAAPRQSKGLLPWYCKLEALADEVVFTPQWRDLFTPGRLKGSELLGPSVWDAEMFSHSRPPVNYDDGDEADFDLETETFRVVLPVATSGGMYEWNTALGNHWRAQLGQHTHTKGMVALVGDLARAQQKETKRTWLSAAAVARFHDSALFCSWSTTREDLALLRSGALLGAQHSEGCCHECEGTRGAPREDTREVPRTKRMRRKYELDIARLCDEQMVNKAMDAGSSLAYKLNPPPIGSGAQAQVFTATLCGQENDLSAIAVKVFATELTTGNSELQENPVVGFAREYGALSNEKLRHKNVLRMVGAQKGVEKGHWHLITQLAHLGDLHR
ncbi:hypothetical protein CYMTET_38091 [Cymbomonas tetramitiformis]|uniref:Uncharacterized protein n=1 Tax=Cymbomonas tetramitiformis TaxID=36881 RepID=A0AAE0CET1_9CHLO|nr:hypothetical protein CYMTET_38091 [Cymbomonas tetramitiformis]